MIDDIMDELNALTQEQITPTAPDATAGDGLRSAIAVCAWHAADARTRYGNCAECARPGRHPMTGPEVTVADRLRSELLAEFGARFQPRSGMSERAVERLADAVLALPALRDVLAAAARDAEAIKRVRKLAKWDGGEMAAAVLHALDGTP